MSHTIGQVQEDNQSSISSQEATRQSTPEDKISKSVLSDADYEFLYNQLLEGISHGWHERRITKFFNQLGDRGKQEDWVAWLERLQDKISVLPIQSKRQLGMLMIRLGELTQSSPQAKEIGAVSNRIGRELLFGNTQDVIWEYVGSDIIPDLPTAELETKEDLSQRLPTDFTELGTAAKETQEEANENESSQNEMTETSSIDAIAPESENLSEITVESKEYKLQSGEQESLQIIDNDLPGDGDISESQTDLLLNNSEEDRIDLENPDFIKIDEDPVAIDIDRVMNLIQQDPDLAREISEKLNIVSESQSDLAVETSDNSSDIVSPQSHNFSIELIEGWFNLGLKQASAKEFKGAIASWEKALKINPNLSEAWHNRGSALGRLGKYREAVSSFQKALTIDSQNYQAWNDRAHALYQLQEWSEAAESWHNALKIMPGNYLFWYNRGCALEQLGDWSEAIASYEKSLEINPDFQSARSRYTNLIADNSRSN